MPRSGSLGRPTGEGGLSPRRALAAFATAFLSLGILNFLFHQVLAAGFFDHELKGVALPVGELRPLWPALVYAMSALAIVAFAVRGPTPESRRRGAVLAGGFVGLLTFGTFNLMSYAWLPRWPLSVVVVDTLWHLACGLLSGALLARSLPIDDHRKQAP